MPNPDRLIGFANRVGIETSGRPPLTFRSATSPEVDLKLASPMDYETLKDNRSRSMERFPSKTKFKPTQETANSPDIGSPLQPLIVDEVFATVDFTARRAGSRTG